MADQYHELAISGLTKAQSRGIRSVLSDLGGFDILVQAYIPGTSTLKIGVGGADLTSFLTDLRAQVLSRLGKIPSVDVSRPDQGSMSVEVKCQTANDRNSSR